jgi:hypothetical protein
VPLLMTLAILFGFADALRLPADGALPPTLLAADDLTQGQGLISTVDRVATVIAGPAAGAALAAGGLATAMAVNTALFTGALIAFATLRTHTAVNRRHHAEDTLGVIAGLRYVCRQRHILLILTIVSAINLFLAGPLELGIVLHVEQHGWSTAALGVIFGAFGAAAALGALSLTVYRPRRRPVVAGFACAALSGAAYTSLGYTSTMTASATAAAVAGVAIAPAGALLLGTVQATTAPEFLGRVMSLVSFASFGLTPLGLVGFGYLTHAAGLPLAFLTTGTTVAVLAIAGALLLTTPPPTTSRPRRGSTHRLRITTDLARRRQRHLTTRRQQPPHQHPVPFAVAASSWDNKRSSVYPWVVQRFFVQSENHSWTTRAPTIPDHDGRGSETKRLRSFIQDEPR